MLVWLIIVFIVVHILVKIIQSNPVHLRDFPFRADDIS